MVIQENGVIFERDLALLVALQVESTWKGCGWGWETSIRKMLVEHVDRLWRSLN